MPRAAGHGGSWGLGLGRHWRTLGALLPWHLVGDLGLRTSSHVSPAPALSSVELAQGLGLGPLSLPL